MAIQHVDTRGESAPELLFERHYPEIDAFLKRDVPVNLFQLSWLENHGVRPATDPDLFAFRGIRGKDGELRAVSLVITDRLALVEARDRETARHFGRWFRDQSISFEHIVSAEASVDPFWEAYRTGPSEEFGANHQMEARLVRPQTMYRLEAGARESEGDSRPEATGVRRATLADLDPLFFASAHMHREETLQDPLERDPGSFREHVRHRVESDRSFVWFNGSNRLKFKADVSAESRYGVQISGVYTAPKMRGRGIATRALHDICETLFEEGVPRIVLYVNCENRAARRVYRKVGFEPHADYATIFVDRAQ